jgi:hypothetical protein
MARTVATRVSIKALARTEELAFARTVQIGAPASTREPALCRSAHHAGQSSFGISAMRRVA